jgi:hypothetical protein
MTVVQVSAGHRAPRAAIAIITALVLSLASAVFVAGWPWLAALLVGLPLLLLVGRMQAGRPGRLTADTFAPRRQIQIQHPDGTLQAALTTPVQQSESRLVLTAEGYLVLNADGQPLYRL